MAAQTIPQTIDRVNPHHQQIRPIRRGLQSGAALVDRLLIQAMQAQRDGARYER